MTRPLERLGIDALEAYFGRALITENDLLNLKEELEIRTTMRAKGLLDKVVKKLAQVQKQGDVPNSPRDDIAVPKVPRDDSVEVPVFVSTPKLEKAQPSLTGSPIVARATNQAKPTPDTPSVVLTQEQALKVLKVPATASWEQIESSRRELVARAQPDRLVALTPERRRAVQDECRQVNAAYKVLLQLKS